ENVTEIDEIDDCILMSDSCTREQIDALAMVLDPSQGITENIEGRLVRINNTKIQTLPYEIPGNFQVWNAKTLIDIRLQDGTGIEIPIEDMKLGDYWYIIGIAGQYDTDEPYSSGYQLLPRFLSDLEKVSNGEPSEELTVNIYPNPFSPDLGECLYIELNSQLDCRITIRIFDIEGRLIKTLLNNRTGGMNYTDWDGTDENREEVIVGIYLVHIQSVKDGDTESVVKPVVVGTPLE
ncbi:T9SS type A sorting domain-containing protein, partial [candidate division WOR-3 bacterium]|nr:T9SS type A sorting domain-containing protein [candidate division WOR-3 bacterium]